MWHESAELLTFKAEILLTVEEIAVLTIAVLSHDTPMRMTAKGYLGLIHRAGRNHGVRHLFIAAPSAA
jgi:hypothetical protein